MSLQTQKTLFLRSLICPVSTRCGMRVLQHQIVFSIDHTHVQLVMCHQYENLLPQQYITTKPLHTQYKAEESS